MADTILSFRPQKGLAINNWPSWGIGTIDHGYYTHPDFTADWYSGHVVVTATDGGKVTDLLPGFTKGTMASHGVNFTTPWFDVKKSLKADYCHIKLAYEFTTSQLPAMQSFRLGHFTLLPEEWDINSLYYAANAGGESLITYPITESFSHDAPVSPQVSARHCIGTGNTLIIGDAHKRITIVTSGTLYAVPMIHFTRFTNGQWFCRVVYSIYERDETSIHCDRPDIAGKSICFVLKGEDQGRGHENEG